MFLKTIIWACQPYLGKIALVLCRISLATCFVLLASPIDYVKKIENKTDGHSMRGIDFIYMINLDQRPEKFEISKNQLLQFGISPYRFSAVNGWELPIETIRSVGSLCKKGSGLCGKMSTTHRLDGNVHHELARPGEIYFCHCASRGIVGICLSHLSVLQDALNSGYETIWVMEDDIEVIRNPHLLTDLINELDHLVGKDKWDILFTDPDTKNLKGQYIPCYSYAWRPDLPKGNTSRFAKRKMISSHFFQIGARYGAYSMIIRRSGIKKLLNFFKTRSLYLPYDMEYFLPENIQLFSLTEDLVSNLPGAISDNGNCNYKKKS